MRRSRAELCDRFWLLTLGMGALIGLILIAVLAAIRGVEEQSAVLLGTVVGGLLMFMREIVQAIRSFWTDERVGKMTDQLASSPAAGGPTDVNIVNPPSDPANVQEQMK